MSQLTLYPYQKQGVDFLTDGYHKLLADDMGLGKTIQVIAAMDKIGATTAVIICPASVKIHWARKITEFSQKQRNIFIVPNGKAALPGEAEVIIVNYELLLRDKIYKQLKARGKNVPYDCVVMDEAHYLKNLDAKRTKRVLGRTSFLHEASYKWALTGTPVLNRPAEIYPLAYTLSPESLSPHLSWLAFAERFCAAAPIRECRRCRAPWGKHDTFCPSCYSKSYVEYGIEAKGCSNSAELAQRLEAFMLRRKKEDVLDQLPAKIETVIELNVNPPCDVDDAPIATVRRELALAKLPQAVSYIKDMLNEVDKIVVFAHHRNVIEGLQEKLLNEGAVICYGGMNANEKQVSIDGFVNNPAKRVFIAQTVAGGTGIDGLQAVCNHVVFVELDWSPGIMSQATDRVFRIGQTKDTVFVHYLAVPESIDTMMAEILEQKRSVINSVIKAQEVQITMSNTSHEKLVAAATKTLNAATSLLKAVEGLVAEAAAEAPAAAPAQKPAAKPAAEKPAAKEPDPEVKPVEQAPPAAKGPTIDEVRKAAGAFISTGPNDKEVNKGIINNQIWPKLGCTDLNSLDPSKFADAITEFEKGPAAFMPQQPADDLGGI